MKAAGIARPEENSTARISVTARISPMDHDPRVSSPAAGRAPGPSPHSDADALRLSAYCINRALPLSLVPASRERAWMEATDRRFANRCLPLLIANQAGWFIICHQTLRAVW